MAELKVENLIRETVSATADLTLDAVSVAVLNLPAQVKIKGTPGEVRAVLTGFIECQRRVLCEIDELRKERCRP